MAAHGKRLEHCCAVGHQCSGPGAELMLATRRVGHAQFRQTAMAQLGHVFQLIQRLRPGKRWRRYRKHLERRQLHRAMIGIQQPPQSYCHIKALGDQIRVSGGCG